MELQEFTDIDGRRRIFEIRQVSVPTGLEYEAVEIQDGESKGMRFCVLGDEDKADILKNRLEEKIKKALAIRHLKYDKKSNTWVTCNHLIRGQIRWDPEHEGQVPLIIVDGKEVTWGEFGRIMMTYEGFQFVLKFVDPSDDMYEVK